MRHLATVFFVSVLLWVLVVSALGPAYYQNTKVGLGCQTVEELNGWESCEEKEHYLFNVIWYGCSRGDQHAYQVVGINAAGKHTEALVCCGAWLKSCTVRAR
jgi:hypothetical protein